MQKYTCCKPTSRCKNIHIANQPLELPYFLSYTYNYVNYYIFTVSFVHNAKTWIIIINQQIQVSKKMMYIPAVIPVEGM